MLFVRAIVAGLCASAVTASAIVKRDSGDDALAILSTLATDLAPLEASLKTALNGVDTTDSDAVVAAVKPDLDAIAAKLGAAGTQIQALPPAAAKRAELAIRQSGGTTDAVGQAIGQIITDLLDALSAIEALIESNPALGAILAPLLSPIDISLGIILTGLGIVLAGVLALVAGLLAGLAGALSGLGGVASGVLGL